MNSHAWPMARLEDVTEVLRRGKAPTYVESSKVAAIGQRCVTATGFDASFARAHSEQAMGNMLIAKEGDVLLNSTGTGTIGRSCVYPGGGVHVVDSHVTVIRTRPDRAIGRWIDELLRSPEGQRHLEGRCFTGSTNQVELSRSQLANSQWPMPPVEEQRRIMEVLAAIDTAVNCLADETAKLREMRAGLAHDLLTRRVRATL